jgi:hypothetical protein
MMKTKIEVVANTIVILLAVVIGSVYLKDRFSTPGPEQNEVKPGDRLAGLDGWDWGAVDRTVVLALRKGCHFCEDSAPFCQRLLTQQQQDGSNAFVAVFPNPADAAEQVVQSEGLRVHTLAGVSLEKLKISGTTLLLVDSKGILLQEATSLITSVVARYDIVVAAATAAQFPLWQAAALITSCSWRGESIPTQTLLRFCPL